MQNYWFANWMSQEGVKDGASLRKALHRRKGRTSLYDGAVGRGTSSNTEAGDDHRTPSAAVTSIVAGKGIDLTGEFSQPGEWLRREITDLFRHVWHYFDRIILPDQAVDPIFRYTNNLRNSLEDLANELEPIVNAVNLLKASGGSEMLAFKYRALACCKEGEDSASTLDSDDTPTTLKKLTDAIVKDGKISWTFRRIEAGHPHVTYFIQHPWFGPSAIGDLCLINKALPTASEIREYIVHRVVTRYWFALKTDILAARKFDIPLGATIPFYRKLLTSDNKPSVSEVAFELDLPVASKCPVAELIRFRADERESFERFQTAVRLAITERLRNSESVTASAIAAEIKRDIIDPELRRIRDRLAASKRLAVQTTTSGMMLGTATAAVGLLSPLQAHPAGPSVAVAGAIGLGASALKKSIEDHFASRRDAALSDMYFLWSASRRFNLPILVPRVPNPKR